MNTTPSSSSFAVGVVADGQPRRLSVGIWIDAGSQEQRGVYGVAGAVVSEKRRVWSRRVAKIVNDRSRENQLAGGGVAGAVHHLQVHRCALSRIDVGDRDHHRVGGAGGKGWNVHSGVGLRSHVNGVQSAADVLHRELRRVGRRRAGGRNLLLEHCNRNAVGRSVEPTLVLGGEGYDVHTEVVDAWRPVEGAGGGVADSAAGQRRPCRQSKVADGDIVLYVAVGGPDGEVHVASGRDREVGANGRRRRYIESGRRSGGKPDQEVEGGLAERSG